LSGDALSFSTLLRARCDWRREEERGTPLPIELDAEQVVGL
jgi:hypothetical protein